MSRDISIRFSRKVIIVSFILSVFVLYIYAKDLAYYNFGDVHGTLIYVLNQIMSETFGRVAEYSCGSKSRIRKFGNRSSVTRKSSFLCLITCPFLWGYLSRPCRICGA